MVDLKVDLSGKKSHAGRHVPFASFSGGEFNESHKAEERYRRRLGVPLASISGREFNESCEAEERYRKRQ